MWSAGALEWILPDTQGWLYPQLSWCWPLGIPESWNHLLCFPGLILRATLSEFEQEWKYLRFFTFHHFSTWATLQGSYYCQLFSDGETEAQHTLPTHPRHKTENMALGFEGCSAWLFLILSQGTKLIHTRMRRSNLCLELHVETACKLLLKGIWKHYFDSWDFNKIIQFERKQLLFSQHKMIVQKDTAQSAFWLGQLF